MVCSEWALKEPTRMSDGDFADVVAPATQSKADSNDFIGAVEPFRRNFGRYPANVCADAGYGLPPSTSRVRNSRSLRRNGCPKREGGSTLIPTKNRNVRSMLRNLSRYRERGVINQWVFQQPLFDHFIISPHLGQIVFAWTSPFSPN